MSTNSDNFLAMLDALKGVVDASTDADTAKTFLAKTQQAIAAIGLTYNIAPGLPAWQNAMAIKQQLQTWEQLIDKTCTDAANAGYILPENPFPLFEQYNVSRQYGQPIDPGGVDLINQLMGAATTLYQVANDVLDGIVSFDRTQPAAQVSSYDVSVDGISQQSGDPLQDLLGYQPDGDLVKRKRALDSLSNLDFTKRKPHVLFLADVIKNGRRDGGTIVTWMRMHDASSYTISRRDVFGMFDLPDASFSNDDLKQTTADLGADPHFRQVLSFYDWVGPADYWAVLDDTTQPDTLYSYVITAQQQRAPSTPYVFDVPTSALFLQPQQQDAVRKAIQDEATAFGAQDPQTISPYSGLSQVVYGDPSYDWVLAGCNVQAAKRAGLDDQSIRSVSYIGSHEDAIMSLLASGRLVVPNDLGSVQSSIETSIGSYGVSQTLLSVLDGVGMTSYIAGKDDPLGFKPTVQSLSNTTGGLAKAIAAIDPASMTVDPSVLVAALSARTDTGAGATGPRRVAATAVYTATFVSSAAQPAVPSKSPIDMVGTDTIDLTTYLGTSRFIRLIRAVYDFIPGLI